MRIQVRCVTHLGVMASLILSFAQAPFQHTHESDPHHPHAKGFVHWHWNSNSAHGLTWEADNHDSDARTLDWLAGDGSAPVKFVVALLESITQPVLRVQVTRISELTPHNHDPPWRLNHLIPRAPPA